MSVTSPTAQPAIEFKGIFVHPDHLAALAPSPSSSISSAMTCLDFSDSDGDYSMSTLALDSPATVVGEDDCDDYFTFGSPKYSPKSLPPASLSNDLTPTAELVASPVPMSASMSMGRSMSRVASSSSMMSRPSPRLVRTPSLYGNENASPAHFPASVPFSMFSPQPTYDAFSPAPPSPAAFPASCFFASRPPSPSGGVSPLTRPSPYARKNSVASLKASSGGASMVRCVSSPVETMSQVTQRRAALSAMTNSIDHSANQMARCRSVAAGMNVGVSSASMGMSRSTIGLGVGGVEMARSPKQRGTPFGDSWGAALPPREAEPSPAPLAFPYNVERTRPAPPARLVRAYSMVNTAAANASASLAPVASPVLGPNRPRRPTLLAPLTPIISGGSPAVRQEEVEAAAAFGQAVARSGASPRMKLQRGRSIC